jgi:hypothetical protein
VPGDATVNPEVQVGLIVAVTTLLSAGVAALATLRSVTNSQRREEAQRRREERKEIYLGFLDATEEMIAAVEECERLRSEASEGAPDDAALRDAKQHLWHTQQRLRRANTTLRLLGNQDADAAGYGVARLLAYRRPDDVELPAQVTLEHGQYREWRRGLQKARYAFTEVARADLGVPRSPSR